MEGLVFLPVPDLTNDIHLLRTLSPDDPPEAAALLDYFDSTYISGRLRQKNPAQNQAVRLVLRRSPPMFPSVIWNVHDATVNGDARTNNMCEGWNNKFFNLVGHMECDRVVSKGRNYCPYYYPARCRWLPTS